MLRSIREQRQLGCCVPLQAIVSLHLDLGTNQCFPWLFVEDLRD